MITPRFLPAAEAELLKEVAFYSNARDGLRIKFEHAVEDAVKRAVANPNGGGPSSAGARNRPVKGFPFKVVYPANDSGILVVAVTHHRRKPGYWEGRGR